MRSLLTHSRALAERSALTTCQPTRRSRYLQEHLLEADLHLVHRSGADYASQTRGMKPLNYVAGGNTLAIYTYLTGDARRETVKDLVEGPGVEYQVRAHFEWNTYQPALEGDRSDGKHFAVARRSLERGERS